MEKQPIKKSLKDFQNSQLKANQLKETKGGWFGAFLERQINDAMKSVMMSIDAACCGNDNGVW